VLVPCSNSEATSTGSLPADSPELWTGGGVVGVPRRTGDLETIDTVFLAIGGAKNVAVLALTNNSRHFTGAEKKKQTQKQQREKKNVSEN
jgi:hypothetical protein